jgi:hypothetical protein
VPKNNANWLSSSSGSLKTKVGCHSWIPSGGSREEPISLSSKVSVSPVFIVTVPFLVPF